MNVVRRGLGVFGRFGALFFEGGCLFLIGEFDVLFAMNFLLDGFRHVNVKTSVQHECEIGWAALFW